MTLPKCIIFDCDGVLVDSEATSIAVLLELGRSIGFELDLETAIERFSGESLMSCLEYIETQTGRSFPDDVIEQFRTLTYTTYKRNLQAIPGIRSLLEGLTLPRCVASNAPLEKIQLNLGILDLLPFFDGHLFSAYTLERWKPDPALFLHAAEKMGFAPSDCVVVEDSTAGVQAARAGGFKVFGYAPSPHRAAALQAAGAEVFEHMSQLPSLWGLAAQ